jgi:type III secretion protein T
MLWVAQNVGYLIDLQTGTQNAIIFDPVNNHEEGPTSRFMLHLVIALVLAGGGLLTILGIIFDSYLIWPVLEGLPRLGESMGDSVAARADSLFSTTVRFAAPIVVLLVLVELSVGLLNRMADGLDVYTLAMPIKSIVAFFTLLVFLSFIYDAVNGFLTEDNDALRVLKELAN